MGSFGLGRSDLFLGRGSFDIVNFVPRRVLGQAEGAFIVPQLDGAVRTENAR